MKSCEWCCTWTPGENRNWMSEDILSECSSGINWRKEGRFRGWYWFLARVSNELFISLTMSNRSLELGSALSDLFLCLILFYELLSAETEVESEASQGKASFICSVYLYSPIHFIMATFLQKWRCLSEIHFNFCLKAGDCVVSKVETASSGNILLFVMWTLNARGWNYIQLHIRLEY